MPGLVACAMADELPGFLSQIQKDRAGFEDSHRGAVGAIGVDDRRDLIVGVQRQEFRAFDIGVTQRHLVRLIGQSGFFEKNRDLDPVRGGKGVELEFCRILWGPTVGDREIGKGLWQGDL